MALPILDGNQTAATLSTIITGGAHIPAHTVVSLGSQAITDVQSAVSGSVVSISNFPASQTIAGTVTAKIDGVDPTVIGNGGSVIQSIPGPDVNSIRTVLWSVDTNSDIGAEVGPANPLPISGTVTVGNSVTIGSMPAISGTVTANVPIEFVHSFIEQTDSYGQVGVSIYGSANPIDISGQRGALTTRFGTPTTASSVFATSAVTNASRKYLLIQNVTTQSNVITVGIGFTPTTTQGIQLTAGAGITFESSYIPTGQIYILSSVTASNFTILEA